MSASPHPSDVFEPVPRQVPAGTRHEGWVGGTYSRWWVYGNQDAAPLVLVHGFRGDHHGLEIIAAGLKDFCVYIPDLPGFGKTAPIEGAEHTMSTYAAWLVSFIETVVGSPVHLVGHSFGSIVSSYTALVRPHLIERLSLINPICQPALEGNQKVMSRLAELYYGAGAALPAPLGFALLRSRWVTRLSSEFMMKNQDPNLRRFINGQHDAYFGAFASREAVLEAYRSSISSTAADFTPALPMAVQLIVAEKDDLGTLELQQAMARKLQQGRLDIIPEVGHLIHYESPLRAASLIADFHAQDLKEGR
ncbi:MAG: alpha/beta hydrolase [Rothia sp. (in: high G+C Gram-positive bacteria)]|uniref:alpha/beta fold hydrolase n=1 Tax=Rothia sp. (in: high G+C Gram-positive bacteria) TaxID=1885016 RepID=UPI0026F9244B|nr:alpha/beta hydrolase [Rothia sp. (in: high G+C Gram-positive bacteria)]